MTQSVFDQHDILDKLYLELKSSYLKGEIATYDQLLKIAPHLTDVDYEEVIKRFKSHIRQQSLMKAKAVDNKVEPSTMDNSAYVVNDSLTSQLNALQQEFNQKVSFIVASHEKMLAHASQGVIEEITSSKIVLEQELEMLKARYDRDQGALIQELEALKRNFSSLQQEYEHTKEQCALMRRDYEVLSLLKLLNSEHGIETLEALPFHPGLNSLILELIKEAKLLPKEQLSSWSVIFDYVNQIVTRASEVGLDLSKLSAQKYEQILKEKSSLALSEAQGSGFGLSHGQASHAGLSGQSGQSPEQGALSEQELALKALKDKFKHIEQLGADNSYFMEDDSFDRHDESTKEDLQSSSQDDLAAQFKNMLEQSSVNGMIDPKLMSMVHDQVSSLSNRSAIKANQNQVNNTNQVPQEQTIELLNIIAHDLLANKQASELTYQDLGQAVKTAMRMQVCSQDQLELISRMLIKIMFTGNSELKSTDFAMSDDELLALIPSEERRAFARGALSWLKNNLNDQSSYSNPLAGLVAGAGANHKGQDALDSLSGSVEIINSAEPKAIPRDEGTLVREMSQEGGDDNIAAFAAASAKIASLAPLLHEAGKELKQAQKEFDADLEKNKLKDRLASHSEDNKIIASSEDDGPLATIEIASVAKDVLKVASELEQNNEDRSQKKLSLFDNSSAAKHTGTTVFGVDSTKTSANKSYDQPKDNFINQNDIDQNDESLDDFITGNISNFDQGVSQEPSSSFTSDEVQEESLSAQSNLSNGEFLDKLATLDSKVPALDQALRTSAGFDNSYMPKSEPKKVSVFDQPHETSHQAHEANNKAPEPTNKPQDDKGVAKAQPPRYVSTATVSATGKTAIIKTTNIDEQPLNSANPQAPAPAQTAGTKAQAYAPEGKAKIEASRSLDAASLSSAYKKGNDSTVIFVNNAQEPDNNQAPASNPSITLSTQDIAPKDSALNNEAASQAQATNSLDNQASTKLEANTVLANSTPMSAAVSLPSEPATASNQAQVPTPSPVPAPSAAQVQAAVQGSMPAPSAAQVQAAAQGSMPAQNTAQVQAATQSPVSEQSQSPVAVQGDGDGQKQEQEPSVNAHNVAPQEPALEPMVADYGSPTISAEQAGDKEAISLSTAQAPNSSQVDVKLEVKAEETEPKLAPNQVRAPAQTQEPAQAQAQSQEQAQDQAQGDELGQDKGLVESSGSQKRSADKGKGKGEAVSLVTPSIFDNDGGFKLKTKLDEDGLRRFKLLCGVIDQRINERISKVNILLHGSDNNNGSNVQVKDVSWFYQSCINSLESQGMLSDDLKKALYEKMEYDIKSNAKHISNQGSNTKAQAQAQDKAQVDKAPKANAQVEKVALNEPTYPKITTMVMPDLSKITGKSTIDWDEFNKDKELANKVAESNKPEEANEPKAKGHELNIVINEPNQESSLNNADSEEQEQEQEDDDSSSNVVQFTPAFKSLPLQADPSLDDVELDAITQSIELRKKILSTILEKITSPQNQSNKFVLLDESNDDSSSDDDTQTQEQAPVVHRHVTFATLNEEDSDSSQDPEPEPEIEPEQNPEPTQESAQAPAQDPELAQEAAQEQEQEPELIQEAAQDHAQAKAQEQEQVQEPLAHEKEPGEQEIAEQKQVLDKQEPTIEPKLEEVESKVDEPQSTTNKLGGVVLEQPLDEDDDDDEELLEITPANQYIKDEHKEEKLNIPRNFSAYQGFGISMDDSYSQPTEATFMFQDINGSKEELKTEDKNNKDSKK